MKHYRYIFSLLFILTTFYSCEIDPTGPSHYKYYVANLSNDSVVCSYHIENEGWRDDYYNTIALSKGEISILYRKNETDTVMPLPYAHPHSTFTDMLFSTTKGDTLLYISPVEDKLWTEIDTTFVYGAIGSKWLYEYRPE
ncbi:MAG: hypothetical protein ACI3Z5_05350 [Paludibacteraceae bacterium]|nr:hypothetical protein [Bacteroidales bacterium]